MSPRAPALRERLIGLLHPGTRLLVLDLSLVSSCDSAGLAVLIGAQRRAQVLGIVMRIAAPSVPVAKLLRLTGLDRSLTICPDLLICAARSPWGGTNPRTHPRKSWREAWLPGDQRWGKPRARPTDDRRPQGRPS